MAGKFFSFKELTRRRDGKVQTLTPSQATALRLLTENVLDPLREATGPIRVTSGFRSDEYNATVPGSATNSQHELGEAADFAPPAGYDSLSIARKIITMGLPFDQLIAYAPERGGHVHVSHKANGQQRGEVRHAPAGSQSEPLGLPDSWGQA